MTTDRAGLAPRLRDTSSTPSLGVRLALGAGLALLALAGVALWASEGAGVFLEQAFAALIACI